jgi:hypothetical protein
MRQKQRRFTQMKLRRKQLLVGGGIVALTLIIILALFVAPLKRAMIPTEGDKLFGAIWSYDTNRVAELLMAGTDPNSIAWTVTRATPLIDAVQFGHDDIVLMLLDKKADPNIADRSGYAALHHALTSPYLESNASSERIVRMLLVQGADLNGKGVGLALENISPNDRRWRACREVLQNNHQPNRVKR